MDVRLESIIYLQPIITSSRVSGIIIIKNNTSLICYLLIVSAK